MNGAASGMRRAGTGNAFGRKLSKDSAADSVEKRWFGRDKPLEESKKSCP